MPEYIVLLRRAREKHFEALQAGVASSAAQFAAYEEGARAAAARRTRARTRQSHATTGGAKRKEGRGGCTHGWM